MKKQLQNILLLTAIHIVCNTYDINAQVNTYNFASTLGTYSEQTGGTVLFQGDPMDETDDEFATVTIPFSFTFNGIAYTTVYPNTNGCVAFGGGTSEYDFPLANIQDESGIVSAFGTDLNSGNLPTSVVTSHIIGAAPNRVLVIQWKNWLSVRAFDSSNLNFQIRLNEAGGIAANQSIQFVYGSIYLDQFTELEDLQVGLRGATVTDFVNRSSLTGWTATVAGTNVEDYVLTGGASLPSVGQTFTYVILAPLDINLKDFSAVNLGVSNQVSWSSASEDAGDKYLLERSTDGKVFSLLAEINGKGKASDYSYLDQKPFSATTFYRLKLVNIDLSVLHSSVVSATVKSVLQNISIYPNPANNAIFFHIYKAQTTPAILIFDQLGKVVMTTKTSVGLNQLDISSLPKGMYALIYSSGLVYQTAKFIKE